FEIAACSANMPAQHHLIVRYEDPWEAPQRGLERICNLRRVRHEVFSTQLRKRDAHLVGGKAHWAMWARAACRNGMQKLHTRGGRVPGPTPDTRMRCATSPRPSRARREDRLLKATCNQTCWTDSSKCVTACS